MSEVNIPSIPDLGSRSDEITIFAGPCSVESVEQFDDCLLYTSLVRQLRPVGGHGVA